MTELSYTVHVAPSLPTTVTDLPPDLDRRVWSPISATLIAGERDAVLVDAVMTSGQAAELADWIAATGKDLTMIYVTHGHGDHWFGLGTILQRFPDAKAVAIPSVARNIASQIGSDFIETFWKNRFPGQIPENLVGAEELRGDRFELEGEELVAVDLGHTDTDGTTALHVPSIGLVVAGDAAYNDVHLYLAESDAVGRRSWLTALDIIEKLSPRSVVAGHKRPERADDPAIIEETRQYIRDFDALAARTATPVDLYTEMTARYPDRFNRGALWGSARAAKSLPLHTDGIDMAEFTFAPLTPASFLDRAVAVFADRTAIIDGERRFTYRDMSARCRRLAGALAAQGVGHGDRVAALCANSHVMLELHHAVPMMGAVLVTLNTRLSDEEMAGLLAHSGSSVLVATREFGDRARDLACKAGLPCFVAGGAGDSYEDWIAGAGPAAAAPVDERQLLAINYTSGTTGRPKGVMYHHRGAYLQAVAMAYHARLGPGARYLWTLPMFHCNGWCFTWAVTAAGGMHVCLRAVDTAVIWRLLRDEGITHFSAAPTVLTMIAEDPAAGRLDHPVHVDTGGAPPSATLLARMEAMNLAVTHLYGLTETYGPLAINEWQPQWDELPRDEQAVLRARQGVPNIIARPLRVLDRDGRDVRADGEAVGEIAVSGNDVMLGYYRDEEATREVTRSGWMLTGDLAVMHPDGYVEIRDRSKDIIISGGENIASVEVEQVLDSHPAVVESAVVGMPDQRWGEVPVAFVTLRTDDVDADALTAYARQHLARYKVPKRFEFAGLPKTSTGKIQKNILRDRATELWRNQ